jgi:hypothetical protein
MPALRKLLRLLSVIAFVSIGCRRTIQEPPDPLQLALGSQDAKIRKVMADPGSFEVQILYTRIRRTADSIRFTDYSFRTNNKRYFYPASTVKFPIAALALELLNESDSLDRNTRFFLEGDTVVTTFANDIKRVFAVSDNEANNRLMEFLGQDTINKRLHRKGIEPVRISHTLGIHSEERMTKPLLIYLNDSTTSPTKPMLNAQPEPLELEGIKKGKGYYEEDSLMLQPFDFSTKNYYPLESQHGVLKRVIFPQKFPEEQQFHLREDQRSFLLEVMKLLPREAGFDENEFYDSYCKFFMFGDSRERIPSHIKIYNKVGFAFGTLTDCAYIHDTRTGVEFLLSATILVNEDGIFNDDIYEYQETGIPFLAALGRELYQFELQDSN